MARFYAPPVELIGTVYIYPVSRSRRGRIIGYEALCGHPAHGGGKPPCVGRDSKFWPVHHAASQHAASHSNGKRTPGHGHEPPRPRPRAGRRPPGPGARPRAAPGPGRPPHPTPPQRRPAAAPTPTPAAAGPAQPALFDPASQPQPDPCPSNLEVMP